jgi:hypothetical protein
MDLNLDGGLLTPLGSSSRPDPQSRNQSEWGLGKITMNPQTHFRKSTIVRVARALRRLILRFTVKKQIPINRLLVAISVSAFFPSTLANAQNYPFVSENMVECQYVPFAQQQCLEEANEIWQIINNVIDHLILFDLSVDGQLFNEGTLNFYPDGSWGHGYGDQIGHIPQFLDWDGNSALHILDIGRDKIRLLPIDEKTVVLSATFRISFVDPAKGPDVRVVDLFESQVYRRDPTSAYGWTRLYQPIAYKTGFLSN